MSSTYEVGKKLVELCKVNKEMEAFQTLYSPHIVSIEAMAGSPTMPQKMQGMQAILGKAEWWMNNHEVHGKVVHGPWPHGDQFVVNFKYEVTPKVGPMAGKRIMLDEAALYTVKDGKITEEKFFYHMGE